MKPTVRLGSIRFVQGSVRFGRVGQRVRFGSVPSVRKVFEVGTGLIRDACIFIISEFVSIDIDTCLDILILTVGIVLLLSYGMRDPFSRNVF